MRALIIAPSWTDAPEYGNVAPDAHRLIWLRHKVGGNIEGVRPHQNTLPDEWFAYCNDEGKIAGLPVNERATKLAHLAGWPEGDVLCGTVVFLGGADDDGEDTDVPQSLVDLGKRHGLWID